MKLRTIKEYFSNPSLRHILFSGKGGVGKTTLSAATAYWLASRGKRVCVFSTDPQGSLSDVFEQDILGKGEVRVLPRLYAMEIDPDKKVAEYQEKMRAKVKQVYGVEDISKEVEDAIESVAAEPSVVLSTTFDTMVELMRGGRDYYVFDMMPHGHALRFLSLADILGKWVDKRAKSIGTLAQRGRISEELDQFRSRLESLSNIMKDEEHTAFFYVLTPQTTTILDAKKALEKFAQFHIPLSGVIVNMVYPVGLLKELNVPPYIKNRVLTQQENLEVVEREFGQLVLGEVPMFDREPKGIEMISKVAEILFGS